MNERYYRLVGQDLVIAPSNLNINGEEIVFPTEEQYLSMGYKKLVTTGQPAPNKYMKMSPVYVEGETTITQNWELTPIPNIQMIKKYKLEDLKIYDSSSAINDFSINGISMWLNKNDRAALMYSIESEEQLGFISTSIYTNNIPSYKLEMPIQTAKTFLQALEIYAKTCYGVTKEHQNAIVALSDAQQIIDYNFTTNYPTKQSFVL